MLVYLFFYVLNHLKNVIYLSAPPDTCIDVIPYFQLGALTIDFEAKCVRDIDRVIIESLVTGLRIRSFENTKNNIPVFRSRISRLSGCLTITTYFAQSRKYLFIYEKYNITDSTVWTENRSGIFGHFRPYVNIYIMN